LSLINFYLLIFISILIAFRFNSRLIIWIRLEINILRFLPIISSGLNIELENSVKYFIIQRWASIIFLIRFFFCNYLFNRFYTLLIIRIFIKLGISPFHTWFISILKSCSLYILIFLSTIQKLIPLIILNNIYFRIYFYYFFFFFTIFFLLIILSRVINLNKLLALSSLGNIIWLISRKLLSIKLLLIFIVIYIYILLGIYIFYNIFYYSLFIQINRISFFDKIIIIILFISLGGIPPLLGFLRKFLILKIVFIFENIFLFLIIIFSSLILLYHYISRIYFFLTFIPSIKFTFNWNSYSWIKFIYLISFIFFNFICILYI
jgi:NADH:ubiquinone oxidoreductase subunit 2 (subunit N)